MRAKVGFAIALLAAVSFAGCTTRDGGPEILAEAPVWEPGYSWHWEARPGVWDGPDEPSLTNLTLLRPMTMENSTGFLGIYDSGPVKGAGLYEPATLREQHLHASSPDRCMEYRIGGNISPPFLLFPLVAGKKWNGTERLLQYYDGRTGTYHMEAVVIGREPLVVQGVRYADAVRIEFRHWITADEPGDEASAPDHPFRSEPTIVHYSPTAQHVVKQEFPTEGGTTRVPGSRIGARNWNDPADHIRGVMELVEYHHDAKPPTNVVDETELFIQQGKWCAWSQEGKLG